MLPGPLSKDEVPKSLFNILTLSDIFSIKPQKYGTSSLEVWDPIRRFWSNESLDCYCLWWSPVEFLPDNGRSAGANENSGIRNTWHCLWLLRRACWRNPRVCFKKTAWYYQEQSFEKDVL